MRSAISVVVFFMLALAAHGPTTAVAADGARPSGTLLSALAVPQGTTRYTPAPSRKGQQLARGAECPATSGKYCSDQFPVCCLVSGSWGCYAKLSDCKEK